MTAQVPEQIIIDGEVRDLYAAPLYRLLASRRMTLRDEVGWTSACVRGYCGTWEIINRRLYLVRGETRRDREVDTRSMLERLLRRNPQMRDRLYGTEDHLPGGGWFEDSELG
jgi:hypothetical protein